MDTNTEVVKSVIDGFRENPPSRTTSRAFLFKQAQEFLQSTSERSLSRRNRRIIARNLAKRMAQKLQAEQAEVSHSSI